MSKRPSKIERRKTILEGARRVFLQRGFGGARMIDIAKMAAVGKGTLYGHFRGKDELFSTLVLNVLRESLETLSGAALGERPEQALSDTVDFLIKVALAENLDLYRLFLEFWGVPTPRRRETQKQLRHCAEGFRTIVGDLVRRGQRDGHFRPEIDPEFFARTLMAIIDGLGLQMTVLGESLDLRAYAASVRAFLVQAIRTEQSLQGASILTENKK